MKCINMFIGLLVIFICLDRTESLKATTTTFSTLVLTPDVVERVPCEDTSPTCKTNKKFCRKGEASSDWMRTNCRKTCGTCGTPFTNCGGVYEVSSGNITSPGYPARYPNNAICEWTIKGNNSDILNVSVHVFGIEPIYDVLTINEKHFPSGVYETVGRKFKIRFKSDSDIRYGGFFVDWTALSESQKRTDIKESIKVSCYQGNFSVNVDLMKFQLYFPNLQPDMMSLASPSCRAFVEGPKLRFLSRLDDCGMTREENQDYIIYHNKLLASDVSGRSVLGSFDVECRVKRSASVVANFWTSSQASVTGYGNFSLRFAFYKDSQYKRLFTVYPVWVELQRILFAEITLSPFAGNLSLALEYCMGVSHLNDSPRDDVNLRYLIRNKCPVENGVKYSSSRENQIRFQFPAFNFVSSNQLYVICQVYVCGYNTTSSRCVRGCHTNRNRTRKSVDDGTAFVRLSQGPILLLDNANQDAEINQEVYLISGTVTGIVFLVIIVAMVLALLKMKFGLCGRRRQSENH